MASIRVTKDLFLWCVTALYLMAFASLYVQIPGLYGPSGILPISTQLKLNGRHPVACFQDKPSLLWFSSNFGLTDHHCMELLCILGCAFSIICAVSKMMRGSLSFACLWFLYLSVYQVGQTFLSFQWDILLLETGFLTIIIAPLKLFKWQHPTYHHHDAISLWLVRWLLFRLMFASGIVKLTSRCPTWWGLTALNYHYESQCIPTPLAWYAHQLPEWLQRLSVIATYFIEIALPFLFFAPIRRLKLFAFCGQLLLQILIILSGNYNFFNLLTITLCISLLDDRFLGKEPGSYTGSSVYRVIRSTLCMCVYAFLFYQLISHFGLHLDIQNGRVESQIAFTELEFFNALQAVMPFTILMGAISLGAVIFTAVKRSLFQEVGVLHKLWSAFLCTLFAVIAIFMFSLSLVPHSVVDRQAHESLPLILHQWNHKLDRYQLVNSYGLFRRMTGVGGRPEVIVEGSNDLSSWQPYEFMYKPGNVSESLRWIAPHQPRLDWQMWFAALGSYQHNPWFLNMVYRLLNNEAEVVALIKHNPFGGQPPRYIRAKLYHYHYTKYGSPTTDWWQREEVREYLPPVDLKNQQFLNIIFQNGIQIKKARGKKTRTTQSNVLEQFVIITRSFVGRISGLHLIFSLFLPFFCLPHLVDIIF